MDEVSGRFAKWVYDSGIRDGVPERALLAGMKVGTEVLAAGKQRIDWDDYVQMLENYHAAVGLEGMRESAYGFGTSEEIESFGTMAGLFLSPRRLYKFMYSWVGNHFMRNVRFDLSEEKDGSMTLVSQIDPVSRGSEVYFLALTNVLAGSTLRIGCKPAQVEITSLSPHRAEYHLVMPERGPGIVRMLTWPKRYLRTRTLEKEILVRLQEEISEQQVTLARQQKDFSSMIESLSVPLFIIGEDGRALFVNRIARSWFMVTENLGDWSPVDAIEDGAEDRWETFLEMKSRGEEEFSFRRKDQGGAEVHLSFGPAQEVAFARQEARLLIGRDVTQRRRVESQMREAAFEERQKLAHELHDGLGQKLTVIALQSESLSMTLAGLNGEKAAAAKIAAVARNAVEQARDLAHGLAAIDEREDNLRRGLTKHAEELRQGSGFAVRLELPKGELLTLPGQRALEVLRIVQEGCHNAVKHSGGKEIRVSLHLDGPQWELRVTDDGVGIPAGTMAEASGLGLGSMAMRARQLGANLEIGARKDGERGTELILRLSRFTERAPVATTIPGQLAGEIRLVIADDLELVLDGMVTRLSLEADLEICGKVLKRGEIIPMVLESKPDVLLTDMLMDGEDNLDVIRVLRKQCPDLGIVVVSMFDEEHYGAESLAAGADAYVMKASETTELVRIIREIAAARRVGDTVE